MSAEKGPNVAQTYDLVGMEEMSFMARNARILGWAGDAFRLSDQKHKPTKVLPKLLEDITVDVNALDKTLVSWTYGSHNGPIYLDKDKFLRLMGRVTSSMAITHKPHYRNPKTFIKLFEDKKLDYEFLGDAGLKPTVEEYLVVDFLLLCMDIASQALVKANQATKEGIVTDQNITKFISWDVMHLFRMALVWDLIRGVRSIVEEQLPPPRWTPLYRLYWGMTITRLEIKSFAKSSTSGNIGGRKGFVMGDHCSVYWYGFDDCDDVEIKTLSLVAKRELFRLEFPGLSPEQLALKMAAFPSDVLDASDVDDDSNTDGEDDDSNTDGEDDDNGDHSRKKALKRRGMGDDDDDSDDDDDIASKKLAQLPFQPPKTTPKAAARPVAKKAQNKSKKANHINIF